MNESDIKAIITAALAEYDLEREITVDIPDETIEAAAKKAIDAAVAPLLARIEALEKALEKALAAAAEKPAGIKARVRVKQGELELSGKETA